MPKPREIELPRAFTEFDRGLTRQQAENVLQQGYPAVTVYLDGKPAAVLLSIERYRALMELANAVPSPR